MKPIADQPPGQLGRVALWSVACAPAVVYLAFLLRYSRDIPTRDDYLTVLPFLSDWLAHKNLLERLSLLPAQWVSHRIAATRLLALADYAIFGRVDFRHLQWAGWLAWGAVFVLLARAVRRENRSPLVAAVVALLLMQPAGYTNFLMGMQAIQNLGVMAAALLACQAASSRRPLVRILGVLLVAGAPWISANGLVAGAAASLVALACGHRRFAASLIGISALAACLYFHGFKPEQQSFSPARFLEFASAITGSPFALFRLGRGFAEPVGAILLCALGCFLLNPACWIRLPVLCGFSVFFVLTTAMLAYGRMSWGIDIVFATDRYKPYGLLCGAALFLFIHSSRAARRHSSGFGAGAVLASAIYCLLVYAENCSLCYNHAAEAEATAINRQLGTWFISAADEDWTPAIHDLERAEADGTYHLPRLLSAPEIALLEKNSAALNVSANTMRVTARRKVPANGDYLTVARDRDGVAFPRYALALTNDRPVILPAVRQRTPVGRWLGERAFVEQDEASFFLPDMLGLDVPGILLRWPLFTASP